MAGAYPAGLQADDFAYMLGTAALGVENPLGTVDLKTGAFTLIGNMGSGGYSGLAITAIGPIGASVIPTDLRPLA
jgi:hypothetical protein